MRIPLSIPVLEGNERDYLNDCIDSGFVSSVGPFVTRFEEAFANRIGRSHAIACSSGTAALHVALRVAGVQQRDVVPVSDFTFIASINAINYCRAQPLLVDSEPSSWNLDGDRLLQYFKTEASRGRPLPSVIEAVHILGVPFDHQPLSEIREAYAVTIVEDAAESLGASIRDKMPVGAFGELGCFSFNGNKMITAGGGGMIVCDDPQLAERARLLTTQAKAPGPKYVHEEVGYNYRMTNVAAAIGLAQLEQLDHFLASRARICDRYRTALGSEEALAFPSPPPGATSSHWMCSFSARTQELRDKIISNLDRAGIDSRPVWLPAHCQPPYRSARRLGRGTCEVVSSTSLSVPSSVNLSIEEQDRVIDVIRNSIERSGRQNK